MSLRRNRLAAVAALATATVAAIDSWRYAPYLIDDTFISLRYARNWVAGHGLVFNLGERVEGYTNFSFVVVAAAAMQLGIDPIVATKVVSVMAALSVLSLLVWMGRRPGTAGGPPARPADGVTASAGRVAALLLLSLQGFTYWSVASFETMPFTFLLTAAIACLMRERRAARGHWSPLVFIALALTRPEGALLFVVANAAFALTDLPFPEQESGSEGSRALRHAVNVVLFGIGFGAYTAWRWSYYGQLLPNTFYAKVTSDVAQLATGMRQLGEWAAEYPVPAATLLLPLALLTKRGRLAARTQPDAVAISVTCIVYLAYVVLVGGDFMPFYRFYLPVLPLQCLLIAWGLETVVAAAPSRRIGRAVLPAVLLINVAASHRSEQPYRAFVAHRTAGVGDEVGRWLRRTLSSDDVVAVNTAGAAPYASELPTIDMLGLTDTAIARRPVYVVSTGWAGHRRGWGEYVLERRPRVVLWYNSAGLREPFYLSDRELADNPYFRFFYTARRTTLPAPLPAPPRLATFLDAPFGSAPNGRVISGDLGLVAEIRTSPLEHTVLYAGPIQVNYFELDRRDLPLWSLAERAGSDVTRFVDAVAATWSAIPAPPHADSQDAAEVEQLCQSARQAVEAGDYDRARAVLDDAVRRNATVGSPLVYQYVANLGVLSGDLFTAVAAQKEALRLAPDNPLYRQNLVRLLTMPYTEATRSRH